VSKQSFTRGAVILAAASVCSRLLGVAYIMALPRIIRDEGMGLVQMVRPLYNLAVILSVAGLPVALSKLVAEQLALGNTRGAIRVFRLTLLLMMLLGAVFTGVLGLGARWLVTNITRDPLSYPALLAMVPSVFLLAVVAALRGFFQGMQYMTPSAVSQVVEQICRVVAMLMLSTLLMPLGVQYGAAGASAGSAIGAIGGLIVLASYFIAWRRRTTQALSTRDESDSAESALHLLKRLFSFSLPIVLGAILWPTMQMIDTGLVPLRMQVAGYSGEAIREALGYFGMALSLMHFPNVITWALSITLVPAVAEATALRAYQRVQRRVTEALRLAVLFGLPASVGLLLLSREAAYLLFGYPQAGEPLRVLALGTLAVGLFQVCSGILQGLGLVLLPVRNLVIGVLVKLGLNYWLTVLPEMGIKGAAWGTVWGFGVASLLNLMAVCHFTPVRPNWRELVLKPGLASLVMGLAVVVVYDAFYGFITYSMHLVSWNWGQSHSGFVCNGFATLGAVIVGIIVYIIGLLGTGALHQRDLEMVPKIGVRLGRWFHRHGWVK
jgi:stage V sporulation protein B